MCPQLLVEKKILVHFFILLIQTSTLRIRHLTHSHTLIFPPLGMYRCFLSLNWLQFVLPSCARRDKITLYTIISIKKKKELDLNVETKWGNVASLREKIQPCDNQGRQRDACSCGERQRSTRLQAHFLNSFMSYTPLSASVLTCTS